MTKIRVLGRRNSANVQKVMWAIGELSLDYQRDDVGGSFGYPDDYEKLNPNRLVPTIQDGDLTLWESNACVRYLARRYGRDSLWPEDETALTQADQWMAWQRSEYYFSFFQVFLNMIRKPAAKADATQIEAGIKDCARLYAMLNEHLSRQPYIAGDALTMGDIPLGTFTYRYMMLEIGRPSLPHVEAWYERLTGRPAYQKHVMIPFGRNSDEWLVEEKKNAGLQ